MRVKGNDQAANVNEQEAVCSDEEQIGWGTDCHWVLGSQTWDQGLVRFIMKINLSKVIITTRFGCKYLLWNFLRYNGCSCPILYPFCTMALNLWCLPKTRGGTGWTHDAPTRSGPPHVFLYTQVVVFQSMLLLLEGFGSVLMWDWASQIKGWGLDLSRCEKYLGVVLQRPLSVGSEIVYNGPETQNFVSMCHGKSGYFSVRIILITVRILLLNLYSCNAFIFQKFFLFKICSFLPLCQWSQTSPQAGRCGVVSWNTAEQWLPFLHPQIPINARNLGAGLHSLSQLWSTAKLLQFLQEEGVMPWSCAPRSIVECFPSHLAAVTSLPSSFRSWGWVHAGPTSSLEPRLSR